MKPTTSLVPRPGNTLDSSLVWGLGTRLANYPLDHKIFFHSLQSCWCILTFQCICLSKKKWRSDPTRTTSQICASTQRRYNTSYSYFSTWQQGEKFFLSYPVFLQLPALVLMLRHPLSQILLICRSLSLRIRAPINKSRGIIIRRHLCFISPLPSFPSKPKSNLHATRQSSKSVQYQSTLLDSRYQSLQYCSSNNSSCHQFRIIVLGVGRLQRQ
jgi:hypothetical protein